jgi:hypothetical protein
MVPADLKAKRLRDRNARIAREAAEEQEHEENIIEQLRLQGVEARKQKAQHKATEEKKLNDWRVGCKREREKRQAAWVQSGGFSSDARAARMVTRKTRETRERRRDERDKLRPDGT